VVYIYRMTLSAVQPIFRCKSMADALDFYTGILDFHIKYPDESASDPLVTIKNGHAEIQLCTFEGGSGIPVNIYLEKGIDELFAKYLGRGLNTSGKPGSPVHQGPINQTWGAREFYVTDSDGNTLRFRQWLSAS
jgi:catechol 2,3-dioxygenase-like lactoylglutathione lyase family enzyme